MGPNSDFLSWYAFSTTWVIIITTLNFTLFSSSLALNNIPHINDPTNLNDYLYNYSSNSLANKSRTGFVYNVSLPANFSDMEVSIVRLRSSTLWSKGANFSYFDIPPKILTMPYVKRLAIMYENLGNLSSYYYDVHGYKLPTKVIGFAIYNASDINGRTDSKRLNITLKGEKIIKVKFSQEEFVLSQNRRNDSSDNIKFKKCVRFDPMSGLVELKDMSSPNVCLSQGVGHFAIAMPGNDSTISPSLSPSPSSPPSPLLSSEDDRRNRMRGISRRVWWVVGFVVGLGGLILLPLCCFFGIRSSWKIQKMEKIAMNSETLEIKWIGDSKLPFAPVSRTHGALEDD